MNLKKAKMLRKMLRKQGIDPTQVFYLSTKEHLVHPVVTNQHGEKVKDLSHAVQAHTRVLSNGCGRAIYLQMKKVTV